MISISWQGFVAAVILGMGFRLGWGVIELIINLAAQAVN